jgi:hypothetical protein
MRQMSRQQRTTLLLAAANLALVLLFPPYDYLSLVRGNVPTFAGFDWVLGPHHNQALNTNFLSLEIIVILVNAGIAWLLVSKPPKVLPKKSQRLQRGVLWLMAINLTLMLLFPPFENYTAISRAILPSFEGFYFVFADNSQRQLVAPILTIEIVLLLINGGLLMLFLKDRGKEKLTPAQIRALAERLRAQQR